jgi:two-component sensor histidine kinase
MIFMTPGINQGFLVLHPDSAVTRKKPGIVHYSFIKLDNRELSVDSLLEEGGLTVKYDRYNSIQTAFSDHSVFNANRTSYQFALYKGGDTVWNTINEKPEVTFSDLSAGRYQLLVRAANAYDDYSEKISALKITVLPPYWQTWWFRALILILVLLLIYGVYRYRLMQLVKLQRIRNNIASDLHDDIGSTLNSISIYSEVARQQAGKDIPALDLIGTNSRKIIESMSDIVWTINPENDSFERIIVRMRSFAHQLFKAKKVEYSFEADDKLNVIALPMQVRKNFYLVFKEAVTNILKYSEATRVSIMLREVNSAILLAIRDNGKGIPVNAETNGNGLLNMKRRAEEIHAKLTIHSSQTEGTGIELMLKT